jgi:predicted DNA-binding antitoxin AbrB/MazE fold protein
MTTVLAVYEGGVLRPAHPLPLAEGETVEVTFSKPGPAPDEWERQLRAAKSIQEWVALANANPNPTPDFDVVHALNETRRHTGFRLPDPEPDQGGPA